MYYFIPCTISKGTEEDNPLEFILPMASGVIESIDVEFPAGCCGLAGVKIINEDWQLIPWNNDQWLTGDNRSFILPIHYPVTQPPYRLVIQGYNLDDVYNHTIRIGVMLNENSNNNLSLALIGSG